MRLLTHNLLQCPVHRSYPLTLSHVEELESVEAEYKAEFLLRMLPRLDWSVLRAAALALGVAGVVEQVPEAQPELDDIDVDRDDAMLRVLHAALLETHVVRARLVCGQGGEWYAISKGIPNLIEQAANVAAAADGEEAEEEEEEEEGAEDGDGNCDEMDE